VAERRVELSPGEVWWARPDPAVGREQAGRRPVLIVSGGLYLDTVTTLALAVPLTSTDRQWPNHVRLDGLDALHHPTFAMTEQVRTISRGRLLTRIGVIGPADLSAVRGWIVDYLLD